MHPDMCSEGPQSSAAVLVAHRGHSLSGHSKDREEGGYSSGPQESALEDMMDGLTQHMYTHRIDRQRALSHSTPGMGLGALDTFGHQLLHMYSVCLCVRGRLRAEG